MNKFKQFLNMFNMFEMNLNARSYKSALIRIFASILIMFAVLAFRLNVNITNLVANIFLTIFLLAIMILCILCFFIAAVECLQVGDNRKKDKERKEFNERYK